VSGCSLYPKLAFFALRDIKAGEELTFDYHPQQPHNKPKVTTLHPITEPWAGTYIYI
jgi:SET domain-containing protein